MSNLKQKTKLYKVYNQKKSNLEKRLEQEFLDHGIATIPCKVSGMDDIISSYSVPGYESLDDGFVEYVNGIVDFVPDYYPIVLSIVGTDFSEEEQETIRGTIEADFAYDLGAVEKENRHQRNIFIFVMIGLIISSVMLGVFDWWSTVPTELLFVVFWFFADTFVNYILLDGRELRKQRLKAARLACLKVTFSKDYDERDYSEKEAEELFEDICEEKK